MSEHLTRIAETTTEIERLKRKRAVAVWAALAEGERPTAVAEVLDTSRAQVARLEALGKRTVSERFPVSRLIERIGFMRFHHGELEIVRNPKSRSGVSPRTDACAKIDGKPHMTICAYVIAAHRPGTPADVAEWWSVMQ